MLISTFEAVDDAHDSHQVLKGILELIPLSRPVILETLNEFIPFHGADAQCQVNYVKNLLKFTDYCPGSRPTVLDMVVVKLVKLDSLLPKESLEQTASVNDQQVVVATASKTLDTLMAAMFEFCRGHCSGTWHAQRAFYYEMLSPFERHVLCAIGIQHTQFLMLYVCSTKQALYEAFVERLWNLFVDSSTCTTLRKSAADFLASFLANSNFIPINAVAFCLKQVCAWIHAYLDRQVRGQRGDASKIRSHSVFFAACHIAFHVIATRHAELANKTFLVVLHTLDFNRIVSCELNPLRYCHEPTVRRFAQSALQLQVVFCHAIIRKNQRLCLLNDNLVMDTKYPFEKYLLPTSASYAAPLINSKGMVIEDTLQDCSLEGLF